MQEQKNQIQAFGFGDALVRVVMIEGEMWWVAKDVCAVLGISDVGQALDRLDEDERGGCSTPTPGGVQTVAAVNESGLYSLILGSRKPEAKVFKRWVTHEVLPSIRKTGGYGVQSAASTEEIAQRAADIVMARLAISPMRRASTIRCENQVTDSVGNWAHLHCRLIPISTPRNQWTKATVAHQKYIDWCEAAGFFPVGRRHFYRALVGRGMARRLVNGAALYSISILPLSTNGRANHE